MHNILLLVIGHKQSALALVRVLSILVGILEQSRRLTLAAQAAEPLKGSLVPARNSPEIVARPEVVELVEKGMESKWSAMSPSFLLFFLFFLLFFFPPCFGRVSTSPHKKK